MFQEMDSPTGKTKSDRRQTDRFRVEMRPVIAGRSKLSCCDEFSLQPYFVAKNRLLTAAQSTTLKNAAM